MDTEELIEEFRNRIGDTSKSVPETYLLSYVNTALRRLARTDGLAPLFERHDTYELSSLNRDGTPSASWPLEAQGKIIDITKLRLLVVNDSVIKELKPNYLDPNDFFDKVVLPEQCAPGNPAWYTLESIGVDSKLVFSCPPCNLTAIDMIYSVFHPKLRSVADPILISYSYADLILEYIIIIHKLETTDMSTARALYEDLDLIAVQIKEVLAGRKSTLPLRRIVRSF